MQRGTQLEHILRNIPRAALAASLASLASLL
ncbi:MAG: hypothetical protein RL354_1783, partial [Planctomycetota bacterium]